MGLIASRANPHLRAPSLAKEAPLLLTLTSRLMRCRDSAHRAAPVWRVGSLHRAGNLQRSMATRVMAPMKTTAAPIPIVVPPPAESHMLSPLLRLLRVPPLLRLSRVLLVRVLDSRVLLSKRTTRTRLIRLPLRWSAPCKLQLQCHSRATPQAQRPRVPWGATRFELTRGGGGSGDAGDEADATRSAAASAESTGGLRHRAAREERRTAEGSIERRRERESTAGVEGVDSNARCEAAREAASGMSMAEPAATEPAATEPAATEPAATEPAKIEPAMLEPAMLEPAVTHRGGPPQEPIATSAAAQVGTWPTEDGGRSPLLHSLASLPSLLLSLLSLMLTLSLSVVRCSLMAARHCLHGLWEAHHPRLSYVHLFINPISKRCVSQCLFLNLILFRSALFAYEVALPALCRRALNVELVDEPRYEVAVLLLWSLPAYLVCEVVSTMWHCKMSNAMSPAALKQRTRAAEKSTTGRVFELLYARLVYVAFMLQLRLLCRLPIVGSVATLVLSSLLHAYDCFELHWGHRGFSPSERFRLVENHWLYFMGYGSLLAILSMVLRFYDLFVIRTVLYPIYIANAPHAHFEKLRCRALPVFQVAFGVINSALQLAELHMRPKAAL